MRPFQGCGCAQDLSDLQFDNMKLKNTLQKIIHSVCLISVLFLSVFFVLPPIESDAASFGSGDAYLNFSSSDSSFYYSIRTVQNGTWTQSSLNFSQYDSIHFSPSQLAYDGYFIVNTSNGYNYLPYWRGSLLSVTSSNPTDLPNGATIELRSTSSSYKYSFYFKIDMSTPTPAPATPTPEPSTPTPGPATPTPGSSTPTPAPDPNAEAFFGKLGSDAQNGVGAIMTAWTAANSHFYTSVLFIVLPVFLGIVGLIASFFFGGGDDD